QAKGELDAEETEIHFDDARQTHSWFAGSVPHMILSVALATFLTSIIQSDDGYANVCLFCEAVFSRQYFRTQIAGDLLAGSAGEGALCMMDSHRKLLQSSRHS
ncbi:hypothetical protein, partial [Sphingobium yanoikuyae]|uniref:hypothetical protein n=1 Tax=Sphingobium yanoikuyae TaxID=13690 RepID=UPI00242B64C5